MSAKLDRRERRGKIKDRKQKIALLKKELERLRARRSKLTERITAQCAIGRKRAQARIDALRAAEKLALNQRVQMLRAKARDKCRRRRERAKLIYSTEKAKRRAEIRAKEIEAQELRAANEASFTPAELRARARKLERAQERESYILSDIPEKYHPVYRRVKPLLQKRAQTSKASKAELFFEWMEANPEEVIAIVDRDGDRELKRLVKQHEAEQAKFHEEQLRKLRKAGYSKKEAEGLLAAGVDPLLPRETSAGPVPF